MKCKWHQLFQCEPVESQSWCHHDMKLIRKTIPAFVYEDTTMMWELREKGRERKSQNTFNALLQWCGTTNRIHRSYIIVTIWPWQPYFWAFRIHNSLIPYTKGLYHWFIMIGGIFTSLQWKDPFLLHIFWAECSFPQLKFTLHHATHKYPLNPW